MVAELVADHSHAYRRHARRLRSIHGNSPARLQGALLDLANESDRRSAAFRVEAPVAEPKSDVRDFAAAVAAALDGSVLRYSRRQALIKQAAALGIRRFDANLLIAAVQHRLGQDANVVSPKPSASRSWILPLGLIVTMQCAICVAAYFVIHN